MPTTNLPTDTIPKTSFTQAEAKELTRLLKKVEQDKGWMPTQETFEALSAARCLPTVDLIIIEERGILLTVYDAGVTKFIGRWHVPGGYVLPNRTLAEDCNAIALRELEIGVTLIRIVDAEKWTREEHSQGQPVSLYMQCKPMEWITETETRKFFPRNSLPENMIECQHRIITESTDIQTLFALADFDEKH